MSNSIETLRDLAMKADESYLGTHPRDSNNWQANEAFCLAATPAVILRLCEVADKARDYVAALDAVRALMQRGLHKEGDSEEFRSLTSVTNEAEAALRSALSALDKGNTQA